MRLVTHSRRERRNIDDELIITIGGCFFVVSPEALLQTVIQCDREMCKLMKVLFILFDNLRFIFRLRSHADRHHDGALLLAEPAGLPEIPPAPQQGDVAILSECFRLFHIQSFHHVLGGHVATEIFGHFEAKNVSRKIDLPWIHRRHVLFTHAKGVQQTFEHNDTQYETYEESPFHDRHFR